MADFIFKKYPALGNKNFVKFLSSQFMSLTGGYIQNVALSAMIAERGEGKWALGLFLAVSYLPVFLLSFPASKLASGRKIKPLLLVTDGLLFVMSVILMIFRDMPFYALLCFGGVWGVIRAFQTPAAACVPKLICSKENLPSGTAALNLALAAARGIGPVISGVLYSAFGYFVSFAVNAVSYIPSFILIARTEISKTCPHKKHKVKPKLSKALLLLVFVCAFCGTSYNIIFTGVCRSLKLSKLWFSLFMGGVGVGAAICSLTAFKDRKLTLKSAGLGLCVGALMFAKNGYFALGISAVYGFFDYLFFTSALQKISLENSAESIRPAMGIYTAVTTGALPLSYLALSFIGTEYGIGMTLGLCSALILIFSMVLFTKIR